MASISSGTGHRAGACRTPERRGAGQDSQLGPDGEEALRAAEQPAGTRIGARPWDVAVQVDCHAVAERGPSPEDALDRNRPGKITAQEHLGLRVRPSRVEATVELARNVPGALNQKPHGNATAKKPVDTCDMRSEVTAYQDGAAAVGERRAQAARSRAPQIG